MPVHAHETEVEPSEGEHFLRHLPEKSAARGVPEFRLLGLAEFVESDEIIEVGFEFFFREGAPELQPRLHVRLADFPAEFALITLAKHPGVIIPGAGKGDHRADVFGLDGGATTMGAAAGRAAGRFEKGHCRRSAGDAVQGQLFPRGGVRAVQVSEQRPPGVLVGAVPRDDIEIVGEVLAADEAHQPVLPKGEGGDGDQGPALRAHRANVELARAEMLPPGGVPDGIVEWVRMRAGLHERAPLRGQPVNIAGCGIDADL